MKPLHKELKEIRLKKGISLKEISSKTRIRLDYLEKIEAGDYSVSPLPFVRAFLREYAEVVGIDPNLVMSKFDKKINTILPAELNEDPVEEKLTDKKQIPRELEDSIGETMGDVEKTSEDTEHNSAVTDIGKSESEKDEIQTSLFNRYEDRQGKSVSKENEVQSRYKKSSLENNSLSSEQNVIDSSEITGKRIEVPGVSDSREHFVIKEPKLSSGVFFAVFIFIILIVILIIFLVNRGSLF